MWSAVEDDGTAGRAWWRWVPGAYLEHHWSSVWRSGWVSTGARQRTVVLDLAKGLLVLLHELVDVVVLALLDLEDLHLGGRATATGSRGADHGRWRVVRGRPPPRGAGARVLGCSGEVSGPIMKQLSDTYETIERYI